MIHLLLYLGVVAAWGATPLAIKIVVTEGGPFFGAALRVLIALAALLLLRPGIPKLSRSLFGLTARTGIFMFGISFALYFLGETRVDSGIAGVIQATVPIWVCAIGLAIGTSRSWTEGLGTLLGFLGVLLVLAPGIQGSQLDSNHLLGVLFLLLATLSYGIATHLGYRISKTTVSSWDSLKVQFAAALIFLLVLTAGTEPMTFHYSGIGWGSLLFLGVASSLFGYWAYYQLIGAIGPVRASTVTYFVPVVALLLERIYSGHAPSAFTVFGTVLILLGLSFVFRAKAH